MSSFGPNFCKAINDFLDNACGPDITSSRFGDLDNPIHPLFHKKQWTCYQTDKEQLQWLPDAAYTTITPALRLASLLVTEPSMLVPFDHVANGVVKTDATGRDYLTKGPLEGTPLGWEYVRWVFEMMVARTQFTFDDRKSGAQASMTFRTHRATRRMTGHADWATIPELKVTSTLQANGTAKAFSIREASARIDFKHPGWLQYLEHRMAHERSAYQANVLMEFTDKLMHELMHAFGSFVQKMEEPRLAYSEGGVWPEPCYSFEDDWQELGHAYESWLLGHKVWIYVGPKTIQRPRYDHSSTAHTSEAWARTFPQALLKTYGGDMTSPVAQPTAVLENPKTKILTTRVIRAWFLKATWVRIRREGHQFLVKEAERTELYYVVDRPDWTYAGGYRKIQLLLDGKPYKWLVCHDLEDDYPVLVTISEDPGLVYATGKQRTKASRLNNRGGIKKP